MAQAHRLDCEAAAADCQLVVQSESEDDGVGLAKEQIRGVHKKGYTDEELRSEHLQTV